jgi:hypothetical protein
LAIRLGVHLEVYSLELASRFIAALATYGRADNTHLRYSRTSLTASSVQVTVEEDTTHNMKMCCR